MFRLNLILFALLLFWIPTSSLAQTSPDYVVSVLRSDGIVEPFASMHDSTWKPISDHDLSYLARKQPSFYFHSSADSIETLQIGTEVVFDPGGMNRGKGFISSYSKSSPGQNCCYPKPKAGLALNWKTQQSTFIKIDSVQLDESRIKQFYRSSEQEWIEENPEFEHEGKSFVYPGVPTSETARDTLEIGIHYEVTDQSVQGKRLLYFIITRSYPMGCGSTGILQGWGIKNKSGWKLITQSFSVGDCDGKGLGTFIEPHLAFEHHGKIYIGTTLSYYEGEGRQLFEVFEDSLKPLLSAH